MSERGMKKWAPYKSLVEQEKYLKKASQNNVNYHGEELEISYWRNEKINTISSILVKIDPENKKIVLPERKTIYFKELISIERIR